LRWRCGQWKRPKPESCPKVTILQRIVVLLVRNFHRNRVIHNLESRVKDSKPTTDYTDGTDEKGDVIRAQRGA
jgi:hypothetical protein